jgi:hypothetical protein
MYPSRSFAYYPSFLSRTLQLQSMDILFVISALQTYRHLLQR